MFDKKITLVPLIATLVKRARGDLITREPYTYEIVHGTEDFGNSLFKSNMVSIFNDIYYSKLCVGCVNSV